MNGKNFKRQLEIEILSAGHSPESFSQNFSLVIYKILLREKMYCWYTINPAHFSLTIIFHYFVAWPTKNEYWLKYLDKKFSLVINSASQYSSSSFTDLEDKIFASLSHAVYPRRLREKLVFEGFQMQYEKARQKYRACWIGPVRFVPNWKSP